jgi:tetratricopeptide (TPR) repeat protein
MPTMRSSSSLRARFVGRQALFVSVLAGLVAACDPAPSADAAAETARAPAPTAQAVKSAAADDSRLGAARALALASSGGTSPVDNLILAYQKKVEKDPMHTDTWVLLGRAWVRKARESADPGFYLNAKACADLVLDITPGYPLAMNLIAQGLLSDHKFSEARDIAEQILIKDPEDLMALGTLSDTMLELGRHDEAAKAAEKMMDLKPSLPSYARTSYIAWLHGDTKGALESIRLAAESARDPSDPEPRAWALVQAALIFWHQGDYPGADAGFKLALEGFADYPPALVGRARVALVQGEPKRAVDLLEKAHKLSPLVETAWRLGDARAAAGDDKGAAQAYELVVKDGRHDKRTLALFYAVKNRNIEDAVRLAKEEMELRGGTYTADAYAWALYRAGKIPEARAMSDRATRLGTKDASLLYHAGAIRIAAGDVEAGRELVAEALKLNPKFDVDGSAEAAKLVGPPDGAPSK